jgi:DNA-binding NtrC family response regulator
MIRRRICQLAPMHIPVLVTGESGTGKEIVARSIHKYSTRASQPFIAVNCGSFAPTLIESELFGHVQGAFTGASKTKHGLFEAADRGTLFLDEIGEMPLELQSRLLRVLDEGEFMRIGETKPRKVDVRIISATNRDMEEMVNHGTFRSDLHFRLRGGLIAIAPLRERKEDIPALVRHFLGESLHVDAAAMNRLTQLDWPGNVRELSMVVQMLKSMGPEAEISEAAVQQVLGMYSGADAREAILSYQEMKIEALSHFDKEYFQTLLESANGNISRAASMAGMDRKNLRDKLKNLGIYKKENKDAAPGSDVGGD